MWVKVAAGSAVVALSLVVVWSIAHLPETAIASVEVQGTKLVSGDALKSVVEAKLDGSYAFIIPHRNSLLFPKDAIESAALHAFPALSHLTISRNGMKALTVTAEERTVVALWCGATSGTAQGEAGNESCYSVDKDGFVFAVADAGSALVRFYGALPTNPIGATFLNGGFASLNTLVHDIGASVNRAPATVTVDSATSDVELAFVDGGVVKFVRTSDRQSTLENIASVFASQSFKTNKQFEYVDFRFGDKVYVKFKGQ